MIDSQLVRTCCSALSKAFTLLFLLVDTAKREYGNFFLVLDALLNKTVCEMV